MSLNTPFLPDRVTLQEAVEPYLCACPGPAVLEHGLRLVALQRITGIPGLELIAGVDGRIDQESRTHPPYLRSLVDVARELNCRPRYLSDAALRRGYSYSRALRWVRFFHGLALGDADTPTLARVRSLGFGDESGWSRFVKALIGKSPSQLPRAPMEFWVRVAIEDVYLKRGIRGSGAA